MRYCVIMCGGVGSRFWPFSRTDMPKQFLDFFGTGRTLIQMTYDRILPVVDPERIIIVTNRQYADVIREQLPDVPEQNLLFEPARRNTAPCLCWAAHHIHAIDPDASIAVLPSDHIMMKEVAFHETMRRGFEFVEKNPAMLTIGITPTYPNTGYGYIQRGEPSSCEGILKVKSFTEKPDLEMAKFFLKSGEFSWNAGIFLWRADTILEAFGKYAPEIADLFNTGNDFYATPQESAFISEIFPDAKSISIDYAIMEKADNVYMQSADLGWSDLGTWKALSQISPRTKEGNVTQNCRVIADGCTDTLFASTGDKIIVASGLDGYIVADNGNALLIYPLDEEQKIRQIVTKVENLFGDKYI